MDNDFRQEGYDFNDYDDEFSKKFNDDSSRLVDIRIVLTNRDYLELISKAVSNFDLSNFNVNISSIIPTADIEIAKNTISGADLVLVACEDNERGRELFQKFKKSLKNEFNFIEYLKLPSLEELNGYDYGDYEDENVFEDEIANSIIRGGLYSISNLSSINHSKRMYDRIRTDFDRESLKYDKITKENEVLIKESTSLREKNEKLFEEVKILQRELDGIKSDYSDLKSRFESIHSKNSLEVFSLNDLWYDLFDEYLSQDVYKFILISTDNFRPKNLMIGQGAICAQSKEDALDWLKIIKTAFILADTNKQDLDYNNFKSNFKFDDLEEFGVSSGFDNSRSSVFNELNESKSSVFNELNESKSSIFADLDDSIFGNDSAEDENSLSDDGFIYNERFEGNEVEDSNIVDEIFNEKLNENENEKTNDNINVFNLKSLKSMEEDEENISDIDEEINRYIDDGDEDDYDYDEEDIDEDSEDNYSPFSNFWG